MNIVAAKCPSCGADIELDKEREFGFCRYCGTKIYVPNAIQRITGTVSISRQNEAQNLFKRAQQFESSGDLDRAEEYYSRVLDIEAENESARAGYERVRRLIVSPNLTIYYQLTGSSGTHSRMKVLANGKKIGRVICGTQAIFTLPFGAHEICVSINGQMSDPMRINVVGRYTKAFLECKNRFFLRPSLTVRSIT